jgi:hypothetical protein
VEVRFIHLYLIGYFALVAGAAIALWQGGVLDHLPPLWVFGSSLVVIGLGITAFLTAVPTNTTRD